MTYLKNLEKFLFLQHCVFKVDCNFLLRSVLLLTIHHTHSTIILKLVGSKAVHVIEPVHHLHTTCIGELTLHEEL